MKAILPLTCTIILAASILTAGEDDYLRPLGEAPKAKAQRRQGGEAFPPLPLPVTPRRRSENKRPPSPAPLIGKAVWGGHLDYRWDNGLETRVYDWNMVPADCQQLLAAAKRVLKLEYKFQTVDLASFSAAPDEIPILFFSGARAISFTPQERAKLRKYLLDGGTICFDSVVGSPYFLNSALRELQQLIPESPVRRVPADHPVFRMVHHIDKISTNTESDIPPELHGIYVGSRLAAVISPYGMGVGWDNLTPALIPNAKYCKRQSSMELGINIIAYAIGWTESGRAFATPQHSGGDDSANPDHLVFAQIKTTGTWNSDPGAESRFLRQLAKYTGIAAAAKPEYVKLAQSPLKNHPFLFLTGIDAFTLDRNELNALKQYLDDGGFLLANNTLGMNDFDICVRACVHQLYPDAKLEVIPATDPLFSNAPFKFNNNGFNPGANAKYPGSGYPLLLGLRDKDRYKIIYSPVDLAGGWYGTQRPGSIAYEPDSAARLGANIVTYFMTR